MLMLTTSTRTLKISAALVWYVGGIVLASKGSTLLLEANRINPDRNWTWLAIIIGMLIGLVKTRYVFNTTCRKNLARIDLLSKPKAWQFFRPRFFVLLMVMIIAGATLSRMAHHNYALLIGVSILDFSISTALLASSYTFWKLKAFV